MKVRPCGSHRSPCSPVGMRRVICAFVEIAAPHRSSSWSSRDSKMCGEKLPRHMVFNTPRVWPSDFGLDSAACPPWCVRACVWSQRSLHQNCSPILLSQRHISSSFSASTIVQQHRSPGIGLKIEERCAVVRVWLRCHKKLTAAVSTGWVLKLCMPRPDIHILHTPQQREVVVIVKHFDPAPTTMGVCPKDWQNNWPCQKRYSPRAWPMQPLRTILRASRVGPLPVFYGGDLRSRPERVCLGLIPDLLPTDECSSVPVGCTHSERQRRCKCYVYRIVRWRVCKIDSTVHVRPSVVLLHCRGDNEGARGAQCSAVLRWGLSP